MGKAASQGIRDQSGASGLPQWADEVVRIDPYHLPVRIETADKSYKLDRQGAVVRARLSCGLDACVALPARAFSGVAARAMVTGLGAYRVTLELHHRDPALCVPLLVSEDLDDIAADWHSWSRLMKLPMLIIGADQHATALQTMLGAIMVEDPKARRKRFARLRRRPLFLSRRKTGKVGKVIRISGEELIARD
jgi:Family of unknown function (DUF6101)